MAQLTAPFDVHGLAGDRLTPTLQLPGLRSVTRELTSLTPLPTSRPRVRVEPLIHLLAATAALAVLRPAGVHVHPWLALGLVAAWPLVLLAAGCYADRPLAEPRCARLGRVARAGAALGLASWAAAAVAGPVAAPGVLLPTVTAVTAATVAATAVGCLVRPRNVRLALVGAPADVVAAITELGRAPHPFEVAVACLTERPDPWCVGLPDTVHVGVQGAAKIASARGADALLVVPGPDLPPTQVRRLEWEAEQSRTQVYVATALLDVAPSRTSTLQAGGLDAVHVRPAASRGPRRLLKGAIERTAAALTLLLLLPVLVAICVAVRRDSPGSAIFKQQRVGRNGRLFTMYKFRTMDCSAEGRVEDLRHRNEADGVLFKLRQDPRVTRTGALLRRYSLDELPQLWNVVTGTMSLVGPRPALPGEVARYDLDPRRRLAVRPGVTGLWQVSGRSDLSWQESVRLDVQYVDNWSLALDLSIVARTVGAVLNHRGAY